ncbi:hypothetical protein RJ639_039042 [Escallonia herrerae]|uniref:Uncharacterized protein n=1 Tax=Escallonia herrerae TaxID=1293975 RepID=A0AA88WMJ6_9ASTE|nr:hypothetical protein RJ639_039042 [Escallonia herrerae]
METQAIVIDGVVPEMVVCVNCGRPIEKQNVQVVALGDVSMVPVQDQIEIYKTKTNSSLKIYASGLGCHPDLC